MSYIGVHRAEPAQPSRLRLPLLAAALLFGAFLPVALATPAHAQPVESNTSAAAARVVYPRWGEGVIAMTTRTCGTSAPWRSVAAVNRIYGPAFVIYYGRAYTVSCTRPASSTASRSTAPTATGWVSPLPGASCSSGYRTGARPSHNGIDLARPSGTPIRAAHAGRVLIVRWQSGAGWYVALNHGTYKTVYMHMRSRSFLSVGASVRAGQTIGYVGSTGNSTGPHLHFEVQVAPMWTWSSYRSPAPFLRARGVRVC